MKIHSARQHACHWKWPETCINRLTCQVTQNFKEDTLYGRSLSGNKKANCMPNSCCWLCNTGKIAKEQSHLAWTGYTTLRNVEITIYEHSWFAKEEASSLHPSNNKICAFSIHYDTDLVSNYGSAFVWAHLENTYLYCRHEILRLWCNAQGKAL